MQTINDVHLQFAGYFLNDALKPFAYLISKKLSEGHICLHLNDLVEEVETLPGDCQPPDVIALQALAGNGLVASTDVRAPFILDKNRLYLQRYYCYETAIINKILSLITAENEKLETRKSALETQLPFIQQYLSASLADTGVITDWQLVAAILGVLNNFTIITGGPGTGKTTTVAKILALLYQQDENLRVALAAPTGKAAMRMKESLKNTRLTLPQTFKDKFAALTPSTIHRLLKREKDSPYFRHNESNPLPYDVVIVDEASMIDAALFAKLLCAVPDTSRLILLGDKDQLASVEAGSLFGDLCRAKGVVNKVSENKAGFIHRFIKDTLQQIVPADIVNPSSHLLFEHIIQLIYSHRSANHPQIGAFSSAIIRNDDEEIKTFFNLAETGEVEIDSSYNEGKFLAFIKGYEDYINEPDIKKALDKFNRLRILCAVKEGDHGVNAINKKVERFLQSKGLIKPFREFYEHRPVIVTRNYYNLQLFNGDVGILRRDENEELRAYFEDGEGGVRAVLPAYLTEAETVFAMTIHKSQGSEYDNVFVILPNTEKLPLLTRELLYTGVTRTKKRVIVQGTKEVILQTAKGEIKRASGIMERLEEEKLRNDDTAISTEYLKENRINLI